MKSLEKIQPDDFEFLRLLLKKQIGLVLTEDKEYLLQSRMEPVIVERKLNDFSGLVRALRASPSSDLMHDVAEAMTINETSFFRDTKPFEDLQRTLIPELQKNAGTRRNLRFWSAAASTGQEAYSLAMSLSEHAITHPGWCYEILATDIARKNLDKAEEAVYSEFEVQRGMPPHLLQKYFSPRANAHWQVNPELRHMVSFKQHNLLDDFVTSGDFDLILCRNVLIYFDQETKRQVLRKLVRHLLPGGILMLGATESFVRELGIGFEDISCGAYRILPA